MTVRKKKLAGHEFPWFSLHLFWLETGVAAGTQTALGENLPTVGGAKSVWQIVRPFVRYPTRWCAGGLSGVLAKWGGRGLFFASMVDKTRYQVYLMPSTTGDIFYNWIFILIYTHIFVFSESKGSAGHWVCTICWQLGNSATQLHRQSL